MRVERMRVGIRNVRSIEGQELVEEINLDLLRVTDTKRKGNGTDP